MTEPTDDAPDEDLLRVLVRPATAELPRISGSRFVAHASPATSEEVALALVEARRAADPDATHHCWAYILADGRARSSDDGEPRDTAGAPILRHLQGAHLADVVVVVTRWYGGTRLGRGGLVRAYGDATAAVLEAAEIRTRAPVVVFHLDHPYDLTAVVEAELARADATELDATYGATVARRVAVPRPAADDFPARVREATAGRVVPHRPRSAGAGED